MDSIFYFFKRRRSPNRSKPREKGGEKSRFWDGGWSRGWSFCSCFPVVVSFYSICVAPMEKAWEGSGQETKDAIGGKGNSGILFCVSRPLHPICFVSLKKWREGAPAHNMLLSYIFFLPLFLWPFDARKNLFLGWYPNGDFPSLTQLDRM